jgi:KDO2-lipid IV(A) lauroyltransferase
MREFVLLLLLRVVARLPWPALRYLGMGLGALVYRAIRRERRNVLANLRIAYPQLTTKQRIRFAKACLRESAVTFIEMPRIWLSREDLRQRVDSNGLPQKMRDLLSEGKGLILAMPHLGNWEMVASGVDPDASITGLYRPPRQSFIEPLMIEGRSHAKIQVVPTSRAGLKALNARLKRGEVVAILPDQVPKTAGAAAMSAPFFGRESLTMVLLGRLAAKHASPVLFVWAKRLDNGLYQMQYFVADDAIRATDNREAAVALNEAVELCVADCPDQYQWAYQRFKPVNSDQDDPYS